MVFHRQYPPLATGLLLVAAIFFAEATSARAQLRIVTYNTANGSFDGNNIFPRTGMDIVLEAIGDEVTGGIARPIDALILQEQDDPATSTQAFVDLLNGTYGAGTYARSTVLSGPFYEVIHQSLVYNTQTVSLIDEIAFGQTGTGKAARQTTRFQLRPVGYGSSADLYIYNDHYKASTGVDNEARRDFEAQAVRTNADALGQGAHAIYAGDYNIQSSSEAMYQTLLSAGNGQAFDPINTAGTWHNSSARAITHTQSPHDGSDGLVTGGLDDRFDFQLVTGELLDNEGLSYIPGSYHVLGNNGTTYNQAVNAVSNTYPLTSGQLDALAHVSDHLPVVADYQVPAIMDAWLATVPPTVSQGAPVNVDVLVENIANVLTANGADELDYTLSVSGDLFGGSSGIDLALGGGNTHQVTLDTSTEGLRGGTITVSSSSQSVGNPLLTFPVSFTVGSGGGPVFGVIAKDDFDSQINRNSFSQSPAPGAYGSAGDGFEAYQVGGSATIPSQLVDDSAAGSDPLGIVDSSTKADIWFGVTDTVNNDNIPAGNPGTATATWEFDISGATGLQVSIDMGAMGDFESANDHFHWTYALDGNPAAPLFTSSVDEAGSADYTMAGGAVVNLDDPLRMTDTSGAATELSNVFQRLTSLLTGTGGALTLELTATANGSEEAYAFDNIIVKGFTGGSFLEADFTEDGDVDAADLAQWRGDFGIGNGSDADGDGDSDGADLLAWQRQFGMSTHPAALSHAVPEPNTLLLLGFAIASVFWSRRRASERPGYRKLHRFPRRGPFSCLLGLLLVLPAVALADPYDPPAGYYDSATGTGATLKSQLHSIIDNHTIRSYDAARSLLQITDRDPNDPDHMILVYDRDSLDVSAINPGGPIPGWDSGVTWNREHTWPKSRGVDSSGPDSSDLHQLRPSTTPVNSDRGNLNFGGTFGAQNYGPVTDKGAEVWYPGDADAGMIARQQFYMAVRYDGSDSATENLALVTGAPAIGQNVLGDKDRLIEWHYEAVPDDFERGRNDIIYDDYQHNRNPFIDRPEYVWSVFVDQQNDSQIAIDGATVGPDGSTNSTVDLGRVLVGAATPAAQTVSINKNGNDGTYFEVGTTGAATSSLGGRTHAFRMGGTGLTTIDVGLNTNTATAGSRSGAVTIDNLDVTTGGGAGRGANDANDVVSVSLDVVDHANASFASGGDLNTLEHDFGNVVEGLTMSTFDFDIFNLVDTAGFTAALQLDWFSGIGDTDVLTTNLVPLLGASAVEAGSSSLFAATLDTSTVGPFSATYTLNFSDEDLPGASDLGDLTLTLMGTVESAPIDTADFDEDTDIDGSDFLAWQRGFGILANAQLGQGDANHDGKVDDADLVVWGEQFGSTPTVGAVNVPEPSNLALVGLIVVILIWSGSTKQRPRRKVLLSKQLRRSLVHPCGKSRRLLC